VTADSISIVSVSTSADSTISVVGSSTLYFMNGIIDLSTLVLKGEPGTEGILSFSSESVTAK